MTEFRFKIQTDPRPSKEEPMITHGGSGSGNFGHEGRPGEKGGSGPGGGVPLEQRTVKNFGKGSKIVGSCSPSRREHLGHLWNTEVERIHEQFPGTREVRVAVIAIDKDRIRWGCTKGAQGVFIDPANPPPNTAIPKGLAIGIRGDSNLKDHAEKLDIGFDSKSGLATHSMAALFRHEYGHAVQSQFSPEANKEWKGIYSKKSMITQMNQVSSYGSVCEGEFFAEAFSIYTSPVYTQGALPKDIESFMRRRLT